VVDEQKVVLFDLVPHQEENEREEGADGHGDGEHQRHGHDGEGEGLVVAQLEEPVVFVGPVSRPVQKCERTFPKEVRHVQHLNAVGNEDELHEVGRDESCHGAYVAGNEREQVLEGVLLDELYYLLVGDQAGERQDQHVHVHQDQVHVHDLLLHARLCFVVHEGGCYVDEERDDDHVD